MAETNVRSRLYRGGWVEPSGPDTIEVINPSTEEVIGTVPAGEARDVDLAVAAAREAFPAWAATPAAERARLLVAVADGLEARSDEIADTIAREVGTPRKLALRIQTALPIGSFRAAADLAPTVEETTEVANSVIVREPVGVVGAITPWNYPLHQIAAKVAYALAAGCTVVLKPSEVAPLNAFILADVMDEVGFPPGVFNLVSGTGPDVGEALAAHPGIDAISFTGSTRAGTRVATVAAANLTRVALELGGKSANILLDDLDDEAFAKAVKAGVSDSFLNSGQTCSALTRMLVPADRLAEAETIAGDAAAKFAVGDPFDETTRLGPIVSDPQRDRVRDLIRTGQDEGAHLVTGGAETPEGMDRGYFVRPTVFSRVEPSMTIAQEEVFGPVLSILAHDGDDDAVAIANDSRYGLSGGVWSADQDRAMAVARRIRTGQVQVNGGSFNPRAPFGGFKASGIGREYGTYGLEEFLEVKSLQC